MMQQKQLKALSSAIGDFINYWGFRHIHGEIWTQVFLSEHPLSGQDLVKRLKYSKALISPALKELEKFELILQTDGPDARTKNYIANPDVYAVIQKVLREREVPLLEKIHKEFLTFEKATESSDSSDDLKISKDRLSQLETMIITAQMAITALTHTEGFDDISELANFDKKKT
jgi:DNA-binding transcriptional regulator GbsR (MarR family)